MCTELLVPGVVLEFFTEPKGSPDEKAYKLIEAIDPDTGKPTGKIYKLFSGDVRYSGIDCEFPLSKATLVRD